MTGVTPWPADKAARLKEMKTVDNLSITAISHKLGCHTTTVRNQLELIGIKTRRERPDRVRHVAPRLVVDNEPVFVDPDARLRRFSWEGPECRRQG